MTLRGWGEGDIREEGLMHVMMETRATAQLLYIIARRAMHADAAIV